MTSTTSAFTHQPMFTTDELRSTTFIPSHVGMTSMGSVDNEQTESTLTPAESLPFNRIQLGYTVGVAVVVLLMVLVAVAVIIIALLVVKRGQAHKIPEGEEMLASSPGHDIKGCTLFVCLSVGYAGDCRILLWEGNGDSHKEAESSPNHRSRR